MLRRKIEVTTFNANTRHYLYTCIIQMKLVDRKITLKNIYQKMTKCKQNHCKSLVNITKTVIS